MKNQILNIETLTVEIRVLSISQKKMTLSVFNQIREEPLFDKNFNLRGETFGYVNREGFWVVWKKGVELRKTRIRKIKTDIPKYLGGLVSRFKEIDSKIIDEFGFHDYNWRYKDERYWRDVSEDSAKEQLAISNSFVEKYNSFCDELIEGNNQLFISI